MAKTLSLNGLAYEIHGSGLPVLLLHGLTMSRGIFALLIELLCPAFLCVVPDLPGHGASDPVGAEGADFPVLAGRLHGLVTALGLAPPLVVGHSFAALIAAAYAARYPVRGVVTLDQALHVAGVAGTIRAAEEDGALALWAQVRQSFGLEALQAADVAARAEQPPDPLVKLYWRPTIHRTAEASQDMVEAWLREINMPLTEILAQEPGAEYRAWLRGLVPQAETMVLPGATHFPQLSRPEAVAAAIRRAAG